MRAAAALLGLLLALSPAPAPAAPAPLHVEGKAAWETFGAAAGKSFSAKLRQADSDGRLAKIRAAIAAHEAEQPAGWEDLVGRVRQAREAGGEKAMLREANALINAVPYVDGTDGAYMPPSRLFGRGGVCKDFAMAKYLLLRDAGFPEARMRIALLPPRSRENPWHVALIAKAERSGDPLVLDLKPAYVAKQEMARAKTSPKKMISEIREGGLPEAAKRSSSAGFYRASSYPGRLRGLAWVGNASGAAALSKASPLAKACSSPFWRDEADPERYACFGPSGFWLAERSEGVSLARPIGFREASALLAQSRKPEPAQASVPPNPLFGENDASFFDQLRYNDSAREMKGTAK